MWVKINKIKENFWYYPSIITLSRKFWNPRPYKNLKKLLQVENLFHQNFTINLNGDKNFEVFRMVQILKGRKVFLNKQELEEVSQKKQLKKKF